MFKKTLLLSGAVVVLVSCGASDDLERGPYENGVAKRYEYDALGRLKIVEVDGEVKTEYCLDDAGNRTKVVSGSDGC